MSFQFVQVSELARQIVSKAKNVKLEDTTIVWFNKNLQNWKALVITNLGDEEYYEVTYNGNKQEAYLDVYTKISNKVIPSEEIYT